MFCAWLMLVAFLSWSWVLKMEAVNCSEKSVHFSRTTRRRIQECTTPQVPAVFIFCVTTKDISLEILHLILCVRLVAYLPTCLCRVQVTWGGFLSPWEPLSWGSLPTAINSVMVWSSPRNEICSGETKVLSGAPNLRIDQSTFILT
jgi:hypothetical protein